MFMFAIYSDVLLFLLHHSIVRDPSMMKVAIDEDCLRLVHSVIQKKSSLDYMVRVYSAAWNFH